MKAKYMILLFWIILTLSGCDAFKIALIANKSNHPIQLKTDYPYYMSVKVDSTGNTTGETVRTKDLNMIRNRQNGVQIDTTAEDLIVTLQPSQHFFIVGQVGAAWSKIEPYDLNISRLAIYSDSDTIVANSKEEIIKLFDDKRVEYIEELDKNDLGESRKHNRYIIIRK